MCRKPEIPALIDIENPLVAEALPLLLSDKTTKENIMWATESYPSHEEKEQIQLSDIGLIQPRVQKTATDQADRTKSQGEVFTPSWVCNRMNNYIDEEWFGRQNVFNTESDDNEWTPTTDKVVFPESRTWKDYVLSRRIEITCGEAPFVVSRYDTASGKIIPLERRIGLLDRKLRIVNENASDDEWFEWVMKAYQSVYGYEFQGDNLFIARVNLLMTFLDHCNRRSDENLLPMVRKIANIIAWNFWQMDGLTGTIPFSGEDTEQMGLFDEGPVAVPCKIWDWRAGNAIAYNSVKRERGI